MIHEIEIQGYLPSQNGLFLGTAGSYGNEKIHLTLSPDWEGMAVTAAFVTEFYAVSVVVGSDGMVDVPAEATARETGQGLLVIKGVRSDARQYTVNISYFVADHAKVDGITPASPTPTEMEQVLLAATTARAAVEKNPIADNLLLYPYASRCMVENGGITFTRNPDGSVTAEGTATAIARYDLSQRETAPQMLTPGEVYTLTGGTEDCWLYVTHTADGKSVTDGLDSGSGFTFTAEDVPYGIYLWIPAGTVCEGVTIYPMLTKGTCRSAYQPAKFGRAYMTGLLERVAGRAEDFFEVAGSYYDNRDMLTYGALTAVDADYVPGTGAIDNPAFLLLCLMGIPYGDSPYCGKPLKTGSDPWAFDFAGAGLRSAEDICDFLSLAGCRVNWAVKEEPVMEDFSRAGLQVGDILFYTRKDENGDWVQTAGTTHISHGAVVCSAVPGVRYTLLEVTTDPGVVSASDLEDKKADIAAICRPDFSAHAHGRYWQAAWLMGQQQRD